MDGIGGTDSCREVTSSQELHEELIFSRSLLGKQLKELKVPPRERGYDLICTACGRGFKSINSAQNHVITKAHAANKREKQLEQILPSLHAPTEEQFFQLTHFVEHIYMENSAVVKGQTSVRHKVARQLEGLVQQQYPDVTIQLHGSSVSDFALVTSNVNINLTIPESTSKQLNNISSVMKATVSILRNNDVYAEVKEDFFAFNKIPRILFLDKKSGLNCEVRANAGNPMVLAPLLQLYSSVDERVKKLGVVLRYWSQVCGVDKQENGHYPSHMFVIMTIHYLQQRNPPILPVLQETYPDLLPTCEGDTGDALQYITIEGISKVHKALQSWKITNQESLGELWNGLLKYYAIEFDSSRVAVSICQLKPLLRESRQWGTARLAVEDPLIPRSNFARAAASDKVFAYLLSSLKQSYAYFSTSASQTSPVLTEETEPCDFDPVVKKTTQSKVESDDSAIVFAAFDTDDTSSIEVADFVFQSTSTSVSYSQSDATNTITRTSIPLTTVMSDNPDSDFIKFGSFPDRVDVSTDAQSLATDSEPQPKFQVKHKYNVAASRDTERMLVFDMQRKLLVFQEYPTACLSCKRRGHIASKCPEDDLTQIHTSMPKVPPSEQSMKSLKIVLKEFVKSVCSRNEDLIERQRICDRILRDILKVYPEAKLELFGSSANGFGSWNSDLDLCLTLPTHDHVDSEVDKDYQINVIQTIAKLLRESKIYDNIVPITSARVPIVKFRLPKLKLQGDISLENRLALRNTKMMLAYTKIDNRVRLLGYVAKHLAKLCDIGDASSGSLSSYAYILMVIHYLQRTVPPVIPVLQKLHHSGENLACELQGPIINNWNCYYFEFGGVPELVKIWPGYGKNQESVAKLWLGFLRYIVQFDWAGEVITIRQLEPLKKVDKWWISKHMCIEDPFNLDHNLASAISGRMRMYILERFRAALFHHSQRVTWNSIDQILDRSVLVGDTRVPKFMICNICNQRGHKASSCPKVNSHTKSEEKVITHPPKLHPVSKPVKVPHSAVHVRRSLPLHEASVHHENHRSRDVMNRPMYRSSNSIESRITHTANPFRQLTPAAHYMHPVNAFAPRNPGYHYHQLQFDFTPQAQNPAVSPVSNSGKLPSYHHPQ